MYYKDFGIPFTILRIANPYGPRQQVKHSKYSLVGWFIRQAMEGNEIKIFGEGIQLRDYIYVDDIVNAVIKCAETDKTNGEIINLGSGESTRFCDMVSNIVDIVKTGKISYVPWPDNYEKIETGDVSLDISKLRRLTNWSPEFTLLEGIENTYAYYRKNLKFYI
jgi:nucleoside-diphosphate-sugar epimerase